MFEDYYFDDAALQEALAAAGYYTDPVRTPAVMPSTVRAEPITGIGSPDVYEAAAAPIAAPYDLSGLGGLDLSGLDSLYGMNFASNFGGGAMGGIYANDPDLQYVSAPLSNKGNATSQTGGNTFAVRTDQPVRLVDHRTNQVVFEGSGFDAARKATEIGQSLTDSGGRKANYSIQTADPTGNYSTVAYEKKNKSTLGEIANVAGTLLPLAMIPLTMGLSAPLAGIGTVGKIALGAGLGGLGSGLKGDNILKGAALGGLSAAGGSLLGGPLGKVGDIGLRAGTAIGTGLGATAGGLATGQSLKNSLLGGVASGAISYLSPNIAEALSGGTPASTSTSTGTSSGGGGGGGPIVVSGYLPTNVGLTLGGSPNKIQRALGQETEAPYDGLTVTGGRASSVGFDGNQYGAPTEGRSPLDRLTQQEPTEGAEEPLEEIDVLGNRIVRPVGINNPVVNGIDQVTGEIVAKGSKIERPTSGTFVPTDLGVIDRLSGMENYADEIVVTGNKAVPVPINLGPGLGSITDTLPVPKMDPALTEKSTLDKIKDAADIARAAAALIPLIPGGGGGGGGRLAPDTSGLTFTKSPLRPTIPRGGIGGTGGYPYTPETYGRRGGDQETEYLFFTKDPVTGQELLQSAPITTPIVNEPAAPVMVAPSGNTFAEGGEVDDDMVKHLVDYHKNGGHQGPGQVKGIGSGQEDKIPAYLSDGEYVWSAQDVADLGDGSTDEGVRRLDKMRQMVRRQAGRKDVKKIAKPQKGIDRMLKAVGGMA